jgi:hypothetical protein
LAARNGEESVLERAYRYVVVRQASGCGSGGDIRSPPSCLSPAVRSEAVLVGPPVVAQARARSDQNDGAVVANIVVVVVVR